MIPAWAMGLRPYVQESPSPEEEAHQNASLSEQKRHNLAEESSQQGNLAETSRYHTGELGFREEEVQGKNRYYRDLLQDKYSGEDKEARTEAFKLRQDFRTAAKQNDLSAMRGIAAQLHLNGVSVEEQPSSLTEEASAPAPAEEGPPAQPKKTSNFSAKENAELDEVGNRALASQGYVPPGYLKGAPGLKAPTADTSSVQPSMPGSGLPPTPKPQESGGKFVFKDRAGNVVDEYDHPAELAREKTQVAAVFDGLEKAATRPEEQAAASQARAAALGALSSMSAKDAIAAGQKYYETIIGSFKKSGPGAGAGAAGPHGPTKMELQLGSHSDALTDKAVDEGTKVFDPKLGHKTLGDMENAMAGISSGDGVRQRAALDGFIKSMVGSRVSNFQYYQLIGGDGLLSVLEQALNKLANGGQLDPETIASVKSSIAQSADNIRKRIHEAGEAAYQYRVTAASPEKDDVKKSQAERARKLLIGGQTPESKAPEVTDEDAKKAMGF